MECITKNFQKLNKNTKEIEKVLDASGKQFREIAAEGVNEKAKVNRKDEVDGAVEVEKV